MSEPISIGIDLDNTIVCYDELFHRAACEEGLIATSLPRSKQEVRDAVRRRPDGERLWTRLQAIVYGLRMTEAKPFAGAPEFFRRCANAKVRAVIVSHKTPFATLDAASVDLHRPALEWLNANGFSEATARGDAFFEPARAAKLERIRLLHCSHFIDDLREVFDEPEFPSAAAKLLFAPKSAPSSIMPEPDSRGIRTFTSWQQLERFFFS